MDLTYYYGDIIDYSCANNHLELIKWIYDRNSTGLNDMIDNIKLKFQKVCQNNHLVVAIWLYNFIYGLDDTINTCVFTKIFKKVCMKGYLPMAKWLYAIDSSVIDMDSIFANICDELKYGKSKFGLRHYRIPKWLTSLCPRYRSVIIGTKIVSYEILLVFLICFRQISLI